MNIYLRLILLPFIQRDTNGLSSENTELKIRLQAMEQQAHLRDGKFQVPSVTIWILYKQV